MSQKAILMILDGWGKSPDPSVSAVDQAKTPFIDSLYENYAHNSLRTDGLHVGLPEGQMGNSEVGHVNLGAGRIVYQDLAKINLAVENNTLKDEIVLKEAIAYAKSKGKKIHLMGLVSDGGVHSHVNHIKALLQVLSDEEMSEVYLHAFTDGRDVDPKSGKKIIEDIEASMAKTTGKIASIIGRYFAMDRDQRWERVQKAYDVIVRGTGTAVDNFGAALQKSYDNGITDEFIEPLIAKDQEGNALATLEDNDVVIFFNFRTDRGRELTQALSQKVFEFKDQRVIEHFETIDDFLERNRIKSIADINLTQ